ncbi:MAG: FecR domain-containing protein [Thermotogae bacterium]|nr:FecR domain-containing protein [Thermotogota bacterium]
MKRVFVLLILGVFFVLGFSFANGNVVSVNVGVNPENIPANGISKAEIEISVISTPATWIEEQTLVATLTTTLGRFDEKGSQVKNVLIKGGKGYVDIYSTTQPGTAVIEVTVNKVKAQGYLYLKAVSRGIVWDVDYILAKKVEGDTLYLEKKGKLWNTLKAGKKLHEGEQILTWKTGRAILEMRNGSTVEVQPNSQVLIEHLKYNRDNSAQTETVLRVLKGGVRNKVTNLLKNKSKFTVKAGSATAGVRGTDFEVLLSPDGVARVRVYEGSVLVRGAMGAPITVSAGKETFVKPKESPTPPEPLKPLPPEEKAKEAAPTPSVPAPAPQPAPSGFGIGMGTNKVGTTTYFGYRISKDFKRVFGTPLSMGLECYILRDSEGNIRFGESAATDVINAFNIRWVGFETRNFGLKYGEIDPQTYDFLLMRNYYERHLKGVDVRLSALNATVKTLLPFYITQWWPVQEIPEHIAQTSTLYVGRFEYELGGVLPLFRGLSIGTSQIFDSESTGTFATKGCSSTVFDVWNREYIHYAGDVDASYHFGIFTPYAEFAWNNFFLKEQNEGYGYSIGALGNFGPFAIGGGYRYFTPKFAPDYFSNNYLTRKEYTLAKLSEASPTVFPTDIRALPYPTNIATESAGWYAYLQGNVFDLATISINYEDYDNYADSPILQGKAIAKVPPLSKGTQPIIVEAGYIQKKFLTKEATDIRGIFTNENAMATLKLKYPITPGLYTSVNYHIYWTSAGEAVTVIDFDMESSF